MSLPLDDIDPDRLEDFSERLLYTAVRAILRHLNMDGTDLEEVDVEVGEGMEGDKYGDMEWMDLKGNKPLNTPEDCLEYWNSCFKKEKLSCLHFREWWRQKVPKYFSPKPSMNYQKPNEHFEEEDIKRNFFDVLERFLCDGDPSVVFKQLAALDDPPAQCGKVFKMGEPSYSCRDCALDSTCVLCVECFKNSEHGTHRYKMSTSSGGGYCDCGDVEAWKQYPSCSTHALGNQFDGGNALDKLPLEIVLRARQVFTCVLKYAYELLTLDTMMKLPGDLQYKERDNIDPMDDLLEVEDLYATVLYNDEVHTFEEVITTLQRAVECDRNQAVSFVSLIDREGRCIVKCGQFQICSEVRRIVERITGRRGVKPLQVKVTHSHVVAHQIFALRLISWLDEVLQYSEGFRALFSKILVEQEVGLNNRKQPSLLEGIFRHDTVLWKAGRAAVHHLLISGMLLEHVSKKEFSVVFTNNYGAIFKDFILDDHEHSFSVTSLSVQLFTVPSLAHYLISSQDVLSVILRTFISECQQKKNEKGKLQFERNISSFRRVHYLLNDVRYLLSVPPDRFEDNTRLGFLHGYSMLLDILSWMHGMDGHIRQVNQHIEFEADWENGFNLHMKLAPVISLTIRWCSLDRTIFIKALRMLLKRIQAEVEGERMERIECIVDKRFKAEVINYSVAQQEVSMHIPLTRILAGLLVHMEKFDLTWDSLEVKDCVRPLLEQILEYPLRTSVLESQVYAGMWRRNGYSLQHQIYYYHSPRCRVEMYDRDVELLQFCAANLEPEQFLVHLLNKFGLVTWASQGCEIGEEESLRHLTLLVDEFFALLITLLGERYIVGVGEVTKEEITRKDIIQLLCVKPMSHSALNNAMQEDVNHETGLEKVIDQVATFKKPAQGLGKGVYELKEELYSEYDVFFFHYTREDQSKSEEVQRARLKAANSPQVVPPPKLPGLKKNFKGLLDLLESDFLIYLLNLVLVRADDLKSKCFSEDQVHRVLYLVGIGLLEENRIKDQGLDGSFQFSAKAREVGMVSALEALVGSHRIASHKELLAWVLVKLKQALGLKTETVSQDIPEHVDDENKNVSAKKAAAAAERRARIMKQIAAQQSHFMKENAKLFDETPSGLRDHKMSICEWDVEVENGFPVCLGPNRSQASPMDSTYTCILCQEDEELSNDIDSKTLVAVSFIQKSTVLSRLKTGEVENKSEFPYLRSSLHNAPHTSSCGHVMHAACWKKYYDDIVETERRRHSRVRHPVSFDIEKSEFLCPLCRSLSNSVITIIPQYHLLQQPRPDTGELESEDVTGATAVVEHCETMETYEDLSPEPMMTQTVEFSSSEQPGDLEPSSSATVQTISLETEPNSQVPATSSSPTLEASMDVEPPESPMLEVADSEYVDGMEEEEVTQPIVDDAVAGDVEESSGVVGATSLDLTMVSPSPPASSSPSSTSNPPSSPAPSSSSSTTTELGSPASGSSESTFMSADESPKETFKSSLAGKGGCAGSSISGDFSSNLDVNLSYSDWLEALFIALKYRRGLSPDKVRNGGESEPQDEEEVPVSRTSTLIRYDTCPLDQVVAELEASHHDGRSFARLFTVAEGGELVFPTSVYEIMNSFCQTTYRISLGELPHILDEMIPLMVWQSCAFSITSIVVSAMDIEKPVLGSLSSRQNDCLSTLIRFCGVVGSNFGNPKVIRSHSLKLLSTVLEVDTSNPSLLELDMFSLLVALTYSLPSLFNGEGAAPLPSCNIQDLHLLRLLLTAHITQLLFNLEELENTVVEKDGFIVEKDCQCILDLLHIVQEPKSIERSTIRDPNPVIIWQKIMVCSLGFLRSAALFYQYLSGVLAPPELNSILPPNQEFILLCRYLSLPSTPRQLLNSDFSLALVRKWSNHPNVHILLSNPTPANMSFCLKVPQLVSLPRDYSELMNSVSCFSCPRASGDESRAPSMCLLCGEVVCSQSYCCQGELDGITVGACTAHADRCGAGSGFFLRVRECKIIMLSGRTRGCFVSPPYLDQYGETDQGLKRGAPLTLCTQRYEKLRRVWLNHSIPEEVSHTIEVASGYNTTDWIHL